MLFLLMVFVRRPKTNLVEAEIVSYETEVFTERILRLKQRGDLLHL